MYQILTQTAASITELKTNPMGLMAEAGGHTVAILNRNKPAFYCVPPELYDRMMEAIDDLRLIALVKEREGEESIPVELDDLVKDIR